MKLFLIRHGQSQANENRVYAGQSDVPLTRLGREQALRLRPVLEKIPFDRVYSSDLSRAADTARLALPGREMIQTPLIREYALGVLAGRPLGEIRDSLPGDYTAYGGENAEMVLARLEEFLSLLEKDPCQNAAAFVHGGIVGCMMRKVLEQRYRPQDFRCGNCAVNVFEFDGGAWRLFAWNYMAEIE